MPADASGGSPRLAGAGRTVLRVVIVFWVAVIGLMLTHSMFVSHDSLSNYVHVWYVGENLRAGQLPFHMPVLGHGQALTFPYAFLPWFTAGLLWPVLGNWVVTLWIVIGFAGVVAAMFWALPEIRRGWWAAAALLNPTLVMAPIIGQLPFLWATALLFVAVGCWRRHRVVAAVLLAGVAQATHPAVVAPMVAVLVIGWFWFEPRRRRLLVAYAASVVLALPSAYLVLESPVFEDSSLVTKLANFFATLAVRMCVVGVPVVLAALQRHGFGWAPAKLSRLRRIRVDWLSASLVGVAIVLNVGFLGPFELAYAWGGLSRKPNMELAHYANSADFRRGATYRVLRAGDGKVGMYQIVRAGGRLDSELFPESIGRRSFPSAQRYSTFLRGRGVDYVIVFANYDKRWRTNEHALLAEMAAEPQSCSAGVLAVRLETRDPDYDVYRIDDPCRATV